MSEKMKLLITGIKETKWNDKTYYNCTTAVGTEYTTTDEQVKQYVGKEHEFDVNSKEDKNGNMKHYINFPKAGGGGGSKWTSGGKNYGPDPTITAKNTVIMQLVEIVKIYQKTIDTPEKAISFVKDNMNTLWDAYGYKVPEIKPQEPTGASHGHHHSPLKPALVAILKEKFKGWSNISIVKYVGTLGFEMPHDKISGDVYFDRLIEEEANTIINELEKA